MLSHKLQVLTNNRWSYSMTEQCSADAYQSDNASNPRCSQDAEVDGLCLFHYRLVGAIDSPREKFERRLFLAAFRGPRGPLNPS